MAKQFFTNGTGSQQTLTPSQNEKVAIYDTIAEAEADLANLEAGQIVATPDTGDELAQPVDTVASGNMHSVTSNAVAGAKYTNIFSKDLSASGWYKIASFSQRNIGSSVSIELGTGYYYQFSSSHKIQINYGWQNANVLDFAQDGQTVFDKIRICYNSNNRDYMGIYVHYTPNVQNPIYLNINACTYRFTPVNFETDSLTWENTIEYNLGVNGLYINGQSYNLAVDVRNITTTGNVRLTARKQHNVVTVYYSVVNQITAGNDVTFGRLPEGFRPPMNVYGILNKSSGDSHNIILAQEVKVTASGYVSTYTYNNQTLDEGASGCITYIVD